MKKTSSFDERIASLGIVNPVGAVWQKGDVQAPIIRGPEILLGEYPFVIQEVQVLGVNEGFGERHCCYVFVKEGELAEKFRKEEFFIERGTEHGIVGFYKTGGGLFVFQEILCLLGKMERSQIVSTKS